MTDRQTYKRSLPELPPVGRKDERVNLSYREWSLLRSALQDSDDFDPQEPAHKHLLAKLDWHCADSFDPSDKELLA